MKSAKNGKNNEFFVVPLINGSVLMGLVNRPGILKPWSIAHENSQKLRHRPVFGHASQKWIGSYTPFKMIRNPKTMGNSS